MAHPWTVEAILERAIARYAHVNDLAAALRVTSQAVSQWRNGRVSPEPFRDKALAAAADVPLADVQMALFSAYRAAGVVRVRRRQTREHRSRTGRAGGLAERPQLGPLPGVSGRPEPPPRPAGVRRLAA